MADNTELEVLGTFDRVTIRKIGGQHSVKGYILIGEEPSLECHVTVPNLKLNSVRVELQDTDTPLNFDYNINVRKEGDCVNVFTPNLEEMDGSQN